MAEKLLHDGGTSQVYLVVDKDGGQPLVRKTLSSENPPAKRVERLKNEYRITADLPINGIRHATGFGRHKRRPSLFLEYVNAPTLVEAFAGKQHDIEDFLYIAIATAGVLSDIHQHNVIHKDISAANILVDLQRRAVKVIDFGLATKINLKSPELGNPERLEGTLAYISPEQTGRMNRVVDYRCDLYSMGAVFYEMLSASPPFAAADAMQLVHAHIAQPAVPLHELTAHVPVAISNIIAKLLAKNAEDRYQSAAGVAHDLRCCLEQLQQHGRIDDDFAIAQYDYSGRFQIPEKLYGREVEIAALMSAFERSSGGRSELMLVAGYSGTGKSALVREIHKPVTEKRGYFVEGKFDQFQRNVPYFAILQAFESYLNLRLTESKKRLQRLRQNILAAVGTEGQVLTDVLPSLEAIIGPQPEVASVGGVEGQNRFTYVFTRFVRAIATSAEPLVLFIDDLQWADSASLTLLKALMCDQQSQYLLCIGAYRDNEVSESHPFMVTLGEMRDAGVTAQTIEIANLKPVDLSALVSESLSHDAEAAQPLVDLVYRKTAGNAFFVNQFLAALYQDELLSFDQAHKAWLWDLPKIHRRNITDNVVELMAAKVLKLAANTQHVLKLAACIGNSFDLGTLVVISEQPKKAVKAALEPALAEGLLLPLEVGYRFAHDRIQQAVYSLIAENEKTRVHLAVGRLLLANVNDAAQDQQLFDIVNQWNLGKVHLDCPQDRLALAELNLQAGNRAKQASAFIPANNYLQTGIELLPDDHWRAQYDLSLSLYTQAAEVAYLTADFASMDQRLETVLANARNLLDKVLPYEIRILSFKARNQLIEAIQAGLDVLSQLGEDFPEKPTLAHVMVDLVKTRRQLGASTTEQLAQLPEMTDPQKIAAMRIMAGIASSSYWATPQLFPLIIFRMCQLSLRFGNTALSAFGFATYGVILCGVLGFMKQGYEFGKLGLLLLDRFDARAWFTQIYCPIYALINIWSEHVENTLEPLQRSYRVGLETGAIEFACINANIYCIHAYLSGRPLPKIEPETRAYSEAFSHYKQETNANYNEVYHQGMLNFMGQSDDPLVLTGSAYNETQMLAQNIERDDKTGLFFLYFNKLILCYHFADFEQAKQLAEKSRALLEAVLAKLEVPNHHFYEALTLLALYPESPVVDKAAMLARAIHNEHKLKKWAKTAPENYLHKFLLVHAERLRIQGRMQAARPFYDQAIREASNSRYLHEEALAYEVAARFYAEQGMDTQVEFHLRMAYQSYQAWGAQGKLRQLRQQHAQAIADAPAPSNVAKTSVSIQSADLDIGSLDLITLNKAAVAISSEIKLAGLLQVLVRIVVENAGAQSGYLLLNSDNKLLIQAEYNLGENEAKVLQAEPASNSDKIATRVVEYVRRTQQHVLLNDARADGRFARDRHIIAKQPRSVLCLPIINQGRLVGVLYLENNLSTAVFTKQQLDMLSILSGQIAVSLQNAILYQSLEQKVAERTEELHKEMQESDRLLLNILPAETASELKQDGKASTKSYDSVTIMFTDFTAFTQVSAELTPEQLVREVDVCFSAFDSICKAHRIEKIKTIGDAYMCVGGLPLANSTHARDIVCAALEIQQWVAQRKAQRLQQGLPTFDIRIGVNTGAVVAGVVGQHKFAYDLWGEAVNIAARMEQGSESGMINISASTYDLVKDQFVCEYRGRLPAKNMQNIDMYFVQAINEHGSSTIKN